MNVLVVDDEENIVKLVAHWAQKIGLKPQGFTNPLEALEAFGKEDFQIVVTDLKMPQMDGHQLLRKVKAQKPDVEIVIITGHGDIEDAIDAMRQDVYDFIRKPFLSKELIQCLERVVDKILLKEENKRLLRELKEMNKNLEGQVEERTKELVIKNRELEKLDELKSKFIACVSHELRTPLTQIDSGLFVLNSIRSGGHDDSEKKLLQIIQMGSKRLNGVIQHMTKILQAEYKDGELLKREHLSVHKLLETVHKEVSYFADLRKQTIRYEFPKKEIYFHGDKEKLRDVFLNLCMNAIKFTPDGGEIRLILEGGEDSFRVLVQDNGIGLSEDDQLHIFKKFYEAGDVMFHSSGTFQFKAGGLGLGLSIAKLFTEMHGGTLTVESAGKDKGSVFVAIFPGVP